MRRADSSSLIAFVCTLPPVHAFLPPRNDHSSRLPRACAGEQLCTLESSRKSLRTVLFAAVEEEEETVQVGSKEYLEGFVSSPIQDESVAERGSGLEQALKLAAAFSVGLVALFLGFMASNDLL
eukprot:scaffold3875_cov123-Cylindrotheca_fusiformis.AAC.25